MKKKIKMGMIGGGSGSFIGAIHRIAAFLDGEIKLVSGCFSSNFSNSIATGKSLFMHEGRIYENYREMIEEEAKMPDGERIDFISIVTPNHLHFEPAMLALEKGFHVILDKPMTFSLEEALLLEKKAKESGLLFAVTHTYTGYPMVKEAKERIRKGELGNLRRIYVEYHKAG